MYICMSLANSKLFDFVELSRKDQNNLAFGHQFYSSTTVILHKLLKSFPYYKGGETSVFSRYRARISPTSSSLVSPVTTVSLPHDDMSLPI